MFSILTFNAALQDVRILNCSVYCPVKYVKERLLSLVSSLKKLQPDIIFLQEVFHHDLQQLLYQSLAQEYPYITGFAKPGVKMRLDNELLTLSRYPLSNSQHSRFKKASPEERLFTSKGFHHCKVEIPEIGRIDLINIHTTAGGVHSHPEHDRMDMIRMQQINQILKYIAGMDKVIIAGDLNAGPHTSTPNYELLLDNGFVDVFAEVKAEGYTWDSKNPLVIGGVENHLPDQRIDHIFINQSLSKIIKPEDVYVVLDQPCLSVENSKIPLSDHYGVLAEFREL